MQQRGLVTEQQLRQIDIDFAAFGLSISKGVVRQFGHKHVFQLADAGDATEHYAIWLGLSAQVGFEKRLTQPVVVGAASTAASV